MEPQHKDTICYLGKIINLIRCSLNTCPGLAPATGGCLEPCDEAWEHGIDGAADLRWLRCLIVCGCPWRMWAASRFQLWVFCYPGLVPLEQLLVT